MTTQTALFKSAMLRTWDGTLDLNTNQFKIALLATTFAPVTQVAWVAAQTYVDGDFVVYGGNYYEALNAGQSSGAAPSFNSTRGAQTNDNTVVWLCWGICPPSQYDLWSQISAHEVVGTNYGQKVLANPTLAELTHRRVTWSVDDVYFGEMEVTPKYAVIYRNGSENGVVNPLLCYVLLDDTGSTIPLTIENPFTLLWDANGIIKLS